MAHANRVMAGETPVAEADPQRRGGPEHSPVVPLRAHLEAGGGFRSLNEAGGVFETMCDAQLLPPGQLAREIDRHRTEQEADRLGPLAEQHWTEDEWRQTHAWEADYLEAYPDPDLDSLILAALPRSIAATALTRLDEARRPFPITVGVPTPDWNWTCSNCGSAHDKGDTAEGVTISDRPGWSTLEAPLTYCRTCILDAAAQLGGVE